jgi:pantoate--beta-alanine ligase
MDHNTRIVQQLDEMTEIARGWLAGGSVGLVPTRGYIHAGHLALVREARRASEFCVVSIVLSPHAFASPEEFARYPRDRARDIKLLEQEQVDVVFVPEAGDLFPPDFATFVHITGPVAERLEGERHIASLWGYATLMTKLFSLIRPDRAYFGQKNAQRFALVQKLVRDLHIDVKLEMLPTVREADGLAYGSLIHQLTAGERKAVALLYPALLAAQALIEQGERSVAVIEKAMVDVVATSPASPLLRLEYAVACDPVTFVPYNESGKELPGVLTDLLLVITASVRDMRFTDNILLRDGHWLL